MKAMIFAAGIGSRLKEETTDKPKALVEIGGKTLLQRAIEKLKNEKIDELVVMFITSEKKLFLFSLIMILRFLLKFLTKGKSCWTQAVD